MKKNVSLKESRILGIIFTVLLFTSCSKEDVSPNLGTASNSQNQSAQGMSNQTNARLGSANPADVNQPSGQNSPQIIPLVPADATIYISHGECLGKCPAYSVTVKNDGTVVYDGIRYVGTLGTVEFAVKRDLVIRLRERMVRSGFLRLPDMFPFIGDMPRTVTALRMEGELPGHSILKVVVDYGVQVPEELIDLRHMIEAELGIDRLVTRFRRAGTDAE